MDPSNQDAVPHDPASHPDLPQASPGGAPLSPTRIPKKNQPTIEPSASVEMKLPPSLSESENRSNSFDNGNDASLVLPDGVQLPASVSPQMLDGRLRRFFFELSPAQMREVLVEYDDAVREKGDEIRNRAAYLFGVVKRYKSLHERSVSGDPRIDATPQGNLSSKVLARLDTLVQSGFCTADELDLKIKDRMRMLPERDALDAIDEMNGCSRGEIRNFGSYFMGIMNRYMRGERQNPLTRGSNRSRNNNNNGRRYDDKNRNNHRDANGGNDNRFSHYGRNDNQAGSHYGRGDRNDDRDRRSSRDSDRDRYRRRRRSRSRSRSYDSRSRSRSRSPDYRRRRSRSDSRERHRSRRRDHSRDSRRGGDSNGVSIHSSKVYGQNQPGIAMYPPPPPPPPPPPRPQMMQPMPQLLAGQPMPGGLPRSMQPPQQQFVQTLGQIPQQQMQPFLQQPQQLLPQFQPGPNMQPPPIQQMQNFNQNMQQQNQGAKMMMPGSVAGLTNLLLGQPAPAAQPAVDMLALADKAAQALSGGGKMVHSHPQALSGGLPQQMNTAPMSNPNFPPPLAPAPMQQQQSMATEKDLPMMVQYAVQNLRTTGHIEQTLDPPLCMMLKRLPEHAALQSLEIFSSCDLSKMRNKSAYLSGILKKELIKLGL